MHGNNVNNIRGRSVYGKSKANKQAKSNITWGVVKQKNFSGFVSTRQPSGKTLIDPVWCLALFHRSRLMDDPFYSWKSFKPKPNNRIFISCYKIDLLKLWHHEIMPFFNSSLPIFLKLYVGVWLQPTLIFFNYACLCTWGPHHTPICEFIGCRSKHAASLIEFCLNMKNVGAPAHRARNAILAVWWCERQKKIQSNHQLWWQKPRLLLGHGFNSSSAGKRKFKYLLSHK